MSTVLRGAAGAAAAFSLSEGAFPRRAEADAQRPNVLFIAVDDLNDWIGCLGGHPDTMTPNIDRLAARGVLFTQAYCSAPSCNPSRASLLSGVRPSTSGVYHNNQPWRPAMPDVVTLPALFKANAFKTWGRGKIFHGAYPDKGAWHRYIPKGGDPMPPDRPVNGIPHTRHFDWGPVDVPDSEMDDYKVAQWGVDFLEQDQPEPFFLGTGFFRPHLPWYAPPRYFEKFPPNRITLPNVNENDLDDVPKAGRQMARPWGDHKKVTETDNWRKAVSGYLACINFVDAQVGKVLDALEAGPYADNTIIILWGDHGWHLGEKLHWRKFALWEEATHAPLIVSVPGLTTPGSQCDRPVSFLDIYPTLVDLCSIDPPPRQLEGMSLRPLLEHPDRPWGKPAVTTFGRNNHTVRSEHWRYIRYRDGTEELYDEMHDPLEWYNLAEDKQLAGIKENLARWLPQVNAENAERRKK